MANKFVSNLPWILPAVAVGALAAVGFDTVANNFRAPQAAEATTPIAVTAQKQVPVAVVPQPEVSAQLAELLNETGAEAAAAADVDVTRNEGFSIDVLETALDASLEPEAPATAVSAVVEPEAAPISADFFNSAQASLEMDRRCVDDLRTLASQATVYFPTGGLTGEAVGISQAKVLGQLAQQCPGVMIQVIGHSDASGNPVNNQVLSLQRAEAVVTRVGAIGVSESVFVAVGMGDTVPSGVTGTQSNAYYDRRVEFAIIERAAVTTASAATGFLDTPCVALLRDGVNSLSIEYPARGMTISDADLSAASNLAQIASTCPQARLRVVGQHNAALGANEDPSIGRLRSIILMTKLVNAGYPAEQIIIGARSEPISVAGLNDGRVDFDLILEE